MLGIVIGCAGEEDATPPSNPAPPPGGTKAGPAAKSPDPAKNIVPSTAPGDTKKPAEGPKMEGPKEGKAEAPAAKLSSEELAEIKKLPAAEQDAAIKQVVCPVSEHHLGSMEMPVKVTAEGRTFYLCCADCQEGLKADPKAVIAKLDAQAGKK